MSLVLKIALALLVVSAAAGAGGTIWLKDRIQTPDYCTNCHVVAPYYETWKSSEFTAHTHAKLGLVCQDCHTRTVRDWFRELASTATGSYELPLKDHEVVPEKECFSCHVSYEYLAGLTRNLKGPDGLPLGRNPHDSHWGRLECGICHKMHKPSEDFCSECHRFPADGPAWTKALPRFLRTPPASVLE